MKRTALVILSAIITMCIFFSCKPAVNRREMKKYGYKVDRSVSSVMSNFNESRHITSDDYDYAYNLKNVEERFLEYWKNRRKKLIVKGIKSEPTKYIKKDKAKFPDTENDTNVLYLSEITVEEIYDQHVYDGSEPVKKGDKLIACEMKKI